MDRLSHRRASARIRLMTRDGAPLCGRKARFRQTSHSFLFGCGAFDAVELMRTEDEERKAFLGDRMDKWAALFNYGTLPFYWGRYERTQGVTAAPETMKAAQWLKARGITVKGHPLCWHTGCADWLMKYSNDEIMRLQLERIDREVSGFKGVIDMWDVINEVVIMPDFDKYDNAITRLCIDKGRIELVKRVFAAAKEANPTATLLINDFNTSDAYEILVEALLYAGVPIDVVGIQSHQHQGYWGMEKLQRVLARFSKLGLPIHFTENTFVSGHIMPADIVDLNDYQIPEWPSTPEGEERQAREMCEMYTALFEHPLVEAITTWDATDGCWLGAPSGVMTADNKLKPSYNALMELVHGRWETDVTLTTDENGYVELDGFKGGYEVSVQGAKAELTLADDGARELTLK